MSRKTKDSITKDSLSKNHAEDEIFADGLTHRLLEIFRDVKASREERDERMHDHYRAWSVDKTRADQEYNGRSDLNLPQLRKEVETMTRRLMKSLFPPDYLSAESSDLANQQFATVNAQVAQHYLDNELKIKARLTPWVKQGVLYGTSPIRQFWRRDVNEMFMREKYFVAGKDGTLESKFKKVRRDVTLYDGPVFRAEDMFQTWVYPSTASYPDELEIIFWRTKVSTQQLKAKKAEGTACRLDEISNAGTSTEYYDTQERMQQFGETGYLHTVDEGDGMHDLLECWLKVILPGSDKPVAVVVEIVNENIATRIQRNPFWHQQPPIDFMRYILPPPGEFYGRGLPEASIQTQHQLNDVLNQTMDSVNLSLNNVTIINPAFAPNADSFEVEPRAIWWADPSAVKQLVFPDLSAVGLKNASQLRGIISEMSDNSPQLPDPIAGKARSTGQAQLAFNEFQTDLVMFGQQITEEALQPQVEKMHSMLQQFLPDDKIIRISGRYANTWINRVVTAEDIVGRYNFKWNVALNAQNNTIKNQQMLNLLKVLPQIPPNALQRINFNWENFLTKILRDGFEIKDVQNIIETENLNPSIPPAIEHKIVWLNGAIDVQRTDDHAGHIASHRKYLESLPKNDLYKQSVMAEHIQKHVDAEKKAMLEAQLIQAQLQLEAAQPPGQSGNPGQIPESTDAGNLEKGVRG